MLNQSKVDEAHLLNAMRNSPFLLERRLADHKETIAKNRNPQLLIETKSEHAKKNALLYRKVLNPQKMKAKLITKIVREATGQHTYYLSPPSTAGTSLNRTRNVTAPSSSFSLNTNHTTSSSTTTNSSSSFTLRRNSSSNNNNNNKIIFDVDNNPLFKPYAKESQLAPQVVTFGHRRHSGSRVFNPGTMKISLQHGEYASAPLNPEQTVFGIPSGVLASLLHTPSITQQLQTQQLYDDVNDSNYDDNYDNHDFNTIDYNNNSNNSSFNNMINSNNNSNNNNNNRYDRTFNNTRSTISLNDDDVDVTENDLFGPYGPYDDEDNFYSNTINHDGVQNNHHNNNNNSSGSSGINYDNMNNNHSLSDSGSFLESYNNINGHNNSINNSRYRYNSADSNNSNNNNSNNTINTNNSSYNNSNTDNITTNNSSNNRNSNSNDHSNFFIPASEYTTARPHTTGYTAMSGGSHINNVRSGSHTAGSGMSGASGMSAGNRSGEGIFFTTTPTIHSSQPPGSLISAGNETSSYGGAPGNELNNSYGSNNSNSRGSDEYNYNNEWYNNNNSRSNGYNNTNSHRVSTANALLPSHHHHSHPYLAHSHSHSLRTLASSSSSSSFLSRELPQWNNSILEHLSSSSSSSSSSFNRNSSIFVKSVGAKNDDFYTSVSEVKKDDIIKRQQLEAVENRERGFTLAINADKYLNNANINGYLKKLANHHSLASSHSLHPVGSTPNASNAVGKSSSSSGGFSRNSDNNKNNNNNSNSTTNNHQGSNNSSKNNNNNHHHHHHHHHQKSHTNKRIHTAPTGAFYGGDIDAEIRATDCQAMILQYRNSTSYNPIEELIKFKRKDGPNGLKDKNQKSLVLLQQTVVKDKNDDDDEEEEEEEDCVEAVSVIDTTIAAATTIDNNNNIDANSSNDNHHHLDKNSNNINDNNNSNNNNNKNQTTSSSSSSVVIPAKKSTTTDQTFIKEFRQSQRLITASELELALTKGLTKDGFLQALHQAKTGDHRALYRHFIENKKNDDDE